MMRKLLKSAAILGAAAAVGCQGQPPQSQAAMTRSVLDVRATHAHATYAYAPVRVGPPEEPVPATITAPVMPLVSAAPSGAVRAGVRAALHGGYRVRKGDTLFRIAKSHYGDGKKWKQIAMANPGLTPSTLKVGQTIVVP